MTGRLQAGTMLLGLRYSEEQIAEVREGVEMVDLRESTFYKLVRDEGGIAALRRTILSLGDRQFGAATPKIVAKLESIADQAKLEAIIDRILDVSSWKDLLSGK